MYEEERRPLGWTNFCEMPEFQDVKSQTRTPHALNHDQRFQHRSPGTGTLDDVREEHVILFSLYIFPAIGVKATWWHSIYSAPRHLEVLEG